MLRNLKIKYSGFLVLILITLFKHVAAQNEQIVNLKESFYATSDKETKKKIILANDLAWEYAYENKDSALHFADLALLLEEKYPKKYKPELAVTLETYGIIYNISGENQRALNYYLDALALQKELGNKAGIAGLSSNIGVLFYSQEDYKKSCQYSKNALILEIELMDTLGQMGSLMNIYVNLKNLNYLDSAFTYLQQAEQLNNYKKDAYYTTLISSNMSAYYLEKEKYSLSEMYANKVIEAGQNNQNTHAINYSNLGLIYLFRDDLEKAEKFTDSALRIAEHNNNFEILTNAYALKSKIALVQKDFTEHKRYDNLLNTMRDSLLSKENRVILQELETKFEVKEKEALLLQKSLDIERAEQKERNLLYTIIGVIFMLIVVLVFVIQKIRSNKKLKEQNVTIEKQLAEKEVLMREIHHRVKNNIQAIKSIIKIQQREASNQELKANLNETLNRVNAMGAIHTKLYENNNLFDLSSDAYTKELMNNVFNSFNIDGASEEVSLDFETFTLPTDDLLTFGLIINELTTNACKYLDKSADKMIAVSIKNEPDNLVVIFKNSVNKEKQKSGTGFGLKLIDVLCAKLRASKKVEITDDICTVTLKLPLL